jgi:hypothetical protein
MRSPWPIYLLCCFLFIVSEYILVYKGYWDWQNVIAAIGFTVSLICFRITLPDAQEKLRVYRRKN